MRTHTSADVLVLGAGAAGAAAALTAAAAGRRLLVAVKGSLTDGATPWAQGGLAATLDPDDSPAQHVEDTLVAGAGLCDEGAVRTLVAAAPQAIADLRTLGARFDGPDGQPAGADAVLALTREGGHRQRRIVHAGGDASGAEVARVLTTALRHAPGVDVLERHAALQLLTDARGQVVGALLGRVSASGRLIDVVQVSARAVVLATGGFGQAFATTTNPPGSTGDGVALALRAGAPVAGMEFVQFHPTVLWQGPGARGQQVLVSEAVRGEGAVLVDARGDRVMAGRHPMADLAPRDVVSASMHAHMSLGVGGVDDHLWLDARGLGRELLERRFPTIVAACRGAGVDPVTAPVPVAPGAHYACGGVVATMDGRTEVPGLYAVGEVACTGVHGANRLASNSLTEGLVAGRLAGELLGLELPVPGGPPLPAGPVAVADPATRPSTATAMSRWAGVVRDADGLDELLGALDAVDVDAVDVDAAPVDSVPVDSVPLDSAPVDHGAVTLAEVEAANLLLVSRVIAAAALAREESRGCHRRSDVAAPLPEWEQQLRVRLVDAPAPSAPCGERRIGSESRLEADGTVMDGMVVVERERTEVAV